jgi:hypothetical protein
MPPARSGIRSGMVWKTGDFVVDLDAEMPCFPGVSHELTFLLIRGLMVRVHQGALMRFASCRRDSLTPAKQGFFSFEANGLHESLRPFACACYAAFCLAVIRFTTDLVPTAAKPISPPVAAHGAIARSIGDQVDRLLHTPCHVICRVLALPHGGRMSSRYFVRPSRAAAYCAEWRSL